MKKCITLGLLIALAPLVTGCAMLGLNNGKTYDGSDSFTEAHPEFNNTPSYMQPDPQPLDAK